MGTCSAIDTFWATSRKRCHTCMVLLVLVLLGFPAPSSAALSPGGPTAPTASVRSAKQLLDALADVTVSTITVLQPISMPHSGSFAAALVNRHLLVTSPHREMIDWCDLQCRNGNYSRTPFIILGKGAMVTFNRLFFRNFIPHSSSAIKAAELDFTHSPVPFIVSRGGGQATYNLVVLHWTPPMFWVFKQPGSFWQAAAAEEIKSAGEPKPLQLQRPALYSVKSFSTGAGTAAIMDCYMPVDVHGCLTDQPYDVTLVYCPYTFKDSLRNPGADTVLVFHDIGLDRLVNSYRNPAVVNRNVVYTSCPDTRHTIDLDHITHSVLVVAGGSLTFQGLNLQGSKSQNKTDWPGNIPLLLSTFRPVESGTIILRDSTVRVRDMAGLVTALNQLPSGSSTAVEIPDLQPNYEGQVPPQPTDSAFVIKAWQLQRQRWLLSKTGGSTIMDRLGSTASWQYFNVTVEAYQPVDCFTAAVLQGSVLPCRYSTVSTGQQLLEQLGNSSARYIRVASDLTLPPDLGIGRIVVSRIVEVRSCAQDAPVVVDWAGNHDSVIVTGNAIWQGKMVLKGIGWSEEAMRNKESQVVDALHPSGMGIIEYEDVVLQADMPSSAWAPDAGKSSVSQLLGVRDLDASPLNMSLVGPSKLLLRGFYLNRSLVSSGVEGMESFQDVLLRWTEAPQQPSGSKLSQPGVLAAVIVSALLGSAALGAALIFGLLCRRRHTAAASKAGKDGATGTDCSAGCLAWRGVSGPLGGGAAGNRPCLPGVAKGCEGSSVVVEVNDATVTSCATEHSTCSADGVPLDKQPSGVSTASSSHKSRTPAAFGADIAQACKALVTKHTVGRDDDLVLESVLGEGSYGKVFKATWRGTVVAVKIMILPSHMSGKDKREKMAVMETAISSSLTHPNIVQTYTYAVEPVRANSSLRDYPGAEGGAARLSLHDSTCSWRAGSSVLVAGGGQGLRARGSSDSGDMSTLSWEIRLVQELCDLGSMRSAFKQNYFRSACGAVQLLALVETALDVARAMAHLHRHNIVHSDLKARNVLLRSDVQDPRGFTAKVADFGLSVTIDPHCTHVSNAFQGTMTHMAPEVLLHGHISRASDVFAFGVLMWEMYTGQHAYQGVPRALLGHNITKQGMRPSFPPDTPFEWQFLACRCWETDPAIRPSFDQILEELQRIKARWTAARSSGEGSAALSSATPLSSSSTCSDSMAQQAARAAGTSSALPQLQQQPRQLPCIQDTSDTLASSGSCLLAALLQQQGQEALQSKEKQGWDAAAAAAAAAVQQQEVAGGKPLCAAGRVQPGRAVPAPSSAAQAGMPVAFSRLLTTAAAADLLPGTSAAVRQQQQQQQPQVAPAAQWCAPPAGHLCLEDGSRDVLVLLSDCDTTIDSWNAV